MHSNDVHASVNEFVLMKGATELTVIVIDIMTKHKKCLILSEPIHWIFLFCSVQLLVKIVCLSLIQYFASKYTPSGGTAIVDK